MLRPDHVLLNLNLLRVDGLEVLDEFEDDLDLKHILVFIPTESDAEEDIVRSYE